MLENLSERVKADLLLLLHIRGYGLGVKYSQINAEPSVISGGKPLMYGRVVLCH